ncbi:ATP-binding protein [Rhizobium oryzicola]|uniref:histidine kinase n=1 Tax=Rhizobium oryzicola TaxID=1232668 RepID=A0ABT8SUT2_9HYPH|nr:ATP-binding protein [Rhizobium oryzicola]MDO1581899.1 ATP-binding protein [Rhizobium oryzicola]
MTPATPFGGDVIRRASRTTAVLQIFAVILLSILVSLYVDMSNRQGNLRDAIRENAMWSVYQLNREANNLHHRAELIIASGEPTAEALQKLSLSYDIVYSRLTTLEQTKFEENFVADERVRLQLAEMHRIVLESQSLFDAIAGGETLSIGSLKSLEYELGVLSRETSELLVYTNTSISEERAVNRGELESLQRKSIGLIGLLVVSVVFLIVTLRRQLHGVQAAGASLETMAEQLTASWQAAEAGNRAKSQFMATMGHEIRTPLNAILGMVELLELTRLSPEASAHIRTIRRSGETLLDIINEILDYAKIEHGKLELERRTLDLQVLAETSVDMMRGRAAEAGNNIVLDLPQTWRARFIVSDPTRLRQVMLNLMSNAVKFTSQGVVTLRMRQVLIQGTLWLRVEVQDTGIGIEEEGKEKLFRPFSQVDASITRKYGGTGLGLTICKEIIDRFGGRVGVESRRGEGSTFWFELPVQASETPPAPHAQVIALPQEPLRKLRILVAEDNKVNQQVIMGYLAHLGQDVALAENGEVALKLAAAERFDLILMDMQMPVMDGIEATRRLRMSMLPSRDTPVVALTANASEEDRRLCLEAGMAGFHAKPISIAMLHRLILDTGRQIPQAPTAMRPVVAAAQSATAASGPDPVAHRREEIAAVLGEEAFDELLDAFFEDAVELLEGLRCALSEGREKDTDPLLHTLKGAASNIGLIDIAETSQALRKTKLSADDLEMLTHKLTDARQRLAA